MLFDEITERIGKHTGDELKRQLAEFKREQEELADEYEIDSLSEFRERLDSLRDAVLAVQWDDRWGWTPLRRSWSSPVFSGGQRARTTRSR